MMAAARSLVRAVIREGALVLAVGVGAGLAHIGTSSMPFQIGALIDGSRLSNSEAGLFGFFEVGALALGMIVLSRWVDRIAARRMAVVGALLAAGANTTLFVTHAFYAQIGCAIVAGLGYGSVFAAAVAAAANKPQPERIYAFGNGIGLLLILGVLTLLPTVRSWIGAMGIFMALGLFALICSPVFLLSFPPGIRRADDSLAAWRVPGARGLLCVWASFSAGSTAAYAFSERIGRNIHLRPADVAWVLTAGVLVGVLGSVCAAILSGRINRRGALVAGMSVTGASCAALGYSTSLTGFAVGVFAFWISSMFLYSYLLGTAAVLDPGGRVGTLGGGTERLGYALGAAAGGVLADHVSYASTGTFGLVGCLLGMIIGFPSLFRALQEHEGARTVLNPARGVPGSPSGD